MRSYTKWVLSLAALAVVASAAPAAQGAIVTVRVEGATQTLFEAPVETTPHLLRSASDTQDRTCDTTNNGASPTSGPSVTGALDDAAVAGSFDWDGFWSAGFEEYFVSRIGPDEQDDVNFRYWGSLVNGNFTALGGCETPVADGDEVLWAYDAFNQTKALKLTGPSGAYAGQPTYYTVTDTFTGDPVQGADVGGATTDANGVAHKTFASTGTVALKATAPSSIRSNGLSVAVTPAPIEMPHYGTSLSMGTSAKMQNLRIAARNLAVEPGYSDQSDPTLDGATLHVRGGDTDQTYNLSRLGWKAKYKKDLVNQILIPTGEFKYKAGLSAPGPITSVILGKGKFSVSGKRLPLALDLDPNPEPVTVTLTIGNRVRCAVFGGTTKLTVTPAGARRFTAKKAAPPAGCTP